MAWWHDARYHYLLVLGEEYVIMDAAIQRTIRSGEWSHVTQLSCQADPDLDAASSWWQSYLRGSRIHRVAGDPLRRLRVVDAFCGSGGLSLGAKLAAEACGLGYDPLIAIDTDAEALRVHRANFGTRLPYHGNVDALVDYHVAGSGTESHFAYPPKILCADMEPFVGSVDLFLAGPPCQGHSNLNNRTRREDPRNRLYLTAAALAVGIGAKNLVIENVPEVRNDRSNVVESTISVLRAAGYDVDYEVMAADTFGGAQTRRRFFLIASREMTTPITLKLMKQVFAQPARSFGWATGDLVDLADFTSADIYNGVPNLSADNWKRIDYLFDSDSHDLPDAVRPDCHKNGHTYRAVYGRMYWDRPAQTITTGFLTPGRGRYVHPIRRRVITPHEAARLQSFPDTFRFVFEDWAPSRALLTKWIGDAVPPILGYAASMPLMVAIAIQAAAMTNGECIETNS